VKRTTILALLALAAEPLLVGGAVLAKHAVDCGGGACAGTSRADSIFGPTPDALLTALVAAAPLLLAVLVATATLLLTARAAVATSVAGRGLAPAEGIGGAAGNDQVAGLA
jgi:hypothetical protein